MHIARISGQIGVEAQVVVTKRDDDISSLAAHALAERRRPVVAGGGDGTVNAVAGKLAGTDTALGVLPMGTLNHFAKDVGIPLNLDAAVYNLFTGKIRKVDVGEVNGRVFVNNSASASIHTSCASGKNWSAAHEVTYGMRPKRWSTLHPFSSSVITGIKHPAWT